MKDLAIYEVILCDMDGVILDSMPKHALAWQRVFADYGISLDTMDVYTREGMPGRDFIVTMWREKGARVPSEDMIQEIQQKKNSMFKEYTITLFPEIVSLLELFHRQKRRIGVVTGSYRVSVDNLLPVAIRQLCDVIICADDVKRGKPFPDAYVQGVTALKATREKTLVIENAPMGIQAAKSAGLDCVALETSLPEPYLDQADKVYKNHTVLIKEFLEQGVML